MDINELLIQVEQSSGSPDGAPPQARPVGKAESPYRQALSRSLQPEREVERSNAPANAAANTAPALSPPDNQSGMTNDAPPALHAASAAQVQFIAALSVDAESRGSENEAVAALDTIELIQPPVFDEISDQAAAETIVVLTNEVPVPPTNLESLFISPNANGETESAANDTAEAPVGTESPAPPKSLFELTTIELPEPADSFAKPDSQPDGAGSVPLAGGEDVVVDRQPATLPFKPTGTALQPGEEMPQPPAATEPSTGIAVSDEPVSTDLGVIAAPKIETAPANDVVEPAPVDRFTIETAPPQPGTRLVRQQSAVTTEPLSAGTKRSDQLRREDPAQDNPALARQPVGAVNNETAMESIAAPIRSEAAAESRSLLDSADAVPKPIQQNRTEPVQSSPLPPAGQGASLPATALETGPVVSSTGAADVDPEQLVERAAAAIRSAAPNGRQLRIRLNPPHLGPLDMAVTSRDQVLSVRLEVQTQSAHSALLDNVAMLREALAQHGTVLDRIDVQLVEPAPDENAPDFNHDDGRQPDAQSDRDHPQQQTDEQNERAPDENRDEAAAAGNDTEELDIQV